MNKLVLHSLWHPLSKNIILDYMDIEGIKKNFVYSEEQLYELIQRGIDSYYDEELNKFDNPQHKSLYFFITKKNDKLTVINNLYFHFILTNVNKWLVASHS